MDLSNFSNEISLLFSHVIHEVQCICNCDDGSCIKIIINNFTNKLI